MGAGALADDDIQGVILHGGIEDLLHVGVEAMDLVDKQHVPRGQVGKQSRQIPCMADGRAAGHPEVPAHLVGHDGRQGGFSQARRAIEQGVIQGLAPALGRLDVDAHMLLHIALADILPQKPGPEAIFHWFIFHDHGRCDQPIVHGSLLAVIFSRPGSEGPP